jgi:dTDP-4-amino-4,6-dideoxygalactose transaminase
MARPDHLIPFNRPTIVGDEVDRFVAALEGRRISGDGPFTLRCHDFLESRVPTAKALLTTSCTHALEMGALLLDVGPGDEVVVPSFTFVSAANAFVLRGATPVFVDVEEATGNIDPEALEAALTERTRAVVIVHYAGVACDLDRLLPLAEGHGVAVVEDNAHGLFGTWQGRPLGSFGALATLSFHETKNVTCGEGGALLVNDPGLVARAEVIREKGTNRSQFFRGEVDRYSWMDIGSSYLPSDLLAAVLLAQLERAEDIQAARARAWKQYEAGLGDWAAEHGVALPAAPAGCGHAWHSFHLVMADAAARDGLIDHLRGDGIQAAFHYLPLHLSPMGRRLGGREGDCPVTESLSARLVRLPLFTSITDEEVDAVIRAVQAFRPA